MCGLHLNRALAHDTVRFWEQRFTQSFCFFFFLNFPGMVDFREDFHLSVGTGCLFSPVFCSRCVCQLRPQLWCLEDMSTFVPVSLCSELCFWKWNVVFLNGPLLWKWFSFTDKRKVWEGKMCMFFSFSYFCDGCVGLKTTYLYLLSQSNSCFFFFFFFFFSGLFSNPFHGS